ncbi:MAG: glycine betaine/L-proline ABC transporter ATP-binding protein [Bradyrhizobium sp.]|uniref:quaternary amine ABC transporter ATP-binding protein n=1 Tax=Bradyrhizobium sp. TaxID=376 RepID=UPI001D3168A7|nr:glycine betaine/L-proline ABC transporter ATP-binding protein [Bradyrhizobium sp.]MBV9563760.1 glycine betaine/L-proline ABC transporter ATP-binding protein [Bradyrhizobium sp.]
MTNTLPDGNSPLIDCRSVWKVFGQRSEAAIKAITERGLGKSEVLKEFSCVVGVADVSLTLNKGEIFCIMGLSGSGKSTLIRLFNRLIEPSLGQIFVCGKDVAKLNAQDLRATRARDIGMVFQNVALLPNRTVLENAAFGLEVQKVEKERRLETAKKALTTVGLADWVNRFPNELSGGMQQRVGLARAIASDPDIILMDEPFSALDPLIRRQLQDEFRELSKTLGKSAIFITHDLDEAIRIGDRIAIMKDGAIIQVGTAEDIILNPADGYVADFVAGISRLHLVKAHSVMHPVAAFTAARPDLDVSRFSRTSPEADVDELIHIFLDGGQDGVAVLDDGAVVGVVTPRSLLQGVKGKEPGEATAF